MVIGRRQFMVSAGGAVAAALAPNPGRARASSAFWKAGRHIVYSYRGLTPPDELLDRISRGEAGGVIFFGENISSSGQIASVARELQAAARSGAGKSEILLMADQEGGKVNRLPGGPTESAKAVGLSADPASAARRQARTAAAVLAGAGMNTNLAPVLGVHRAEGDFLDEYERSYSGDPEVVGEAAAAYVQEIQRRGVRACAKHFPGLGAAPRGANTDEEPVAIGIDAQELAATDEAPYRPVIAAGVKLVMPSWALYPALDPDDVAGMSERVVRGVLRAEHGFAGAVITDALEAGSLASYGSAGARAVAAIRAGNDLLCCSSRDVAQGDEAAEALRGALGSGDLDEDDFAVSAARLARL